MVFFLIQLMKIEMFDVKREGHHKLRCTNE